MDTLTHIALGAACAEATLGKKIGNRAMVWGAFGGILPDFDVFANLVTNEINALAFHRGIMHSILFIFFAALGLSWWTEWLYRSGHFKQRWYKMSVYFFILILIISVAGSLNYFAFSEEKGLNLQLLAATIAACVWLGWLLWKKYYRTDFLVVTATRAQWFWLFLTSISSHVLLDCFNPYGTQIFQPFSNYPVAFTTLSVLDPLFTLPILVCILLVTAHQKDNKYRRHVNWLGMALGGAYLLFTVWHKEKMNDVFERSLTNQGIQFQRFMTSPTMLNNFLWQGVALGDTAIYHGTWSFLEKEPHIAQFNVLSKNHELVAEYENDKAIRVLKWFTRDYFTVLKIDENTLQVNDLRYGSTGENFNSEDKYVFRFILEDENGKLNAHQLRSYHRMTLAGLKKLWRRIKGERYEE